MITQASKLRVWRQGDLWRFETVVYVDGKRQVLKGSATTHKALIADFKSKFEALQK